MDMFFCDISGTYTGNEETRKRDVENFSKNLSSLIDSDNADKLIFSFISSDNADFVKRYINELQKYITDPRIIFGYQYANDKKFLINSIPIDCEEGKTSQIMEAINLNKDIKSIYFADDTLLFHEMVDYISIMCGISNVYHLIPGVNDKATIMSKKNSDNIYYSNKDGIIGVNECILKKYDSDYKNKVMVKTK